MTSYPEDASREINCEKKTICQTVLSLQDFTISALIFFISKDTKGFVVGSAVFGHTFSGIIWHMPQK